VTSEQVVPGSPRVCEGAVVLRPFSRADVPELIAWAPGPRFLMQWAGVTLTHPLTPEQLADLFEQDSDRPHTMAWQIVDRADGASLGHIELTRIDRERRVGHVSRVVLGSPDARGRGVGGAAIRAVLRAADALLGLREVSLVVFAWNAPAIACYEREGFRREQGRGSVVELCGESWEAIRMVHRVEA
jgi:RimJ/RimL family protein N-acetyltransferase